ncbi:MAG: hypothetical protein GX590_05415 [Lentisphaerae bacterium]|nr:hypothetical protein [Lentisphaerota bacterium]
MNENMQQNAARTYLGALSFYHPNTGGNGSAVQFELKPARGNRDGCFFMVMARQKTAPTRAADGMRQAATFDWQNRLTVKLGFNDVCSLLLVLHGRQECVNNGKGLFHDTPDASTVIQLRRGSDHPGYGLEVSRKAKQNGAEPVRLRLMLTEAEALGLALVFEQSMLLLAYGTPTPEAMLPGARAPEA